jgi:hypothetical protein
VQAALDLQSAKVTNLISERRSCVHLRDPVNLRFLWPNPRYPPATTATFCKKYKPAIEFSELTAASGFPAKDRSQLHDDLFTGRVNKTIGIYEAPLAWQAICDLFWPAGRDESDNPLKRLRDKIPRQC